jgi:hypothetical protein
MTSRSTMQQILSVLTAWLLVQTLLRFSGLFLTTVIVLLTGLTCLTIYGLRFERPCMARLFRKPVPAWWIKTVCRMTDQQIPADLSVEGHNSCLRLKTGEDFEWCRRKLQEEIFGNNAAIQSLVDRLSRNVQLRSRSEQTQSMPPLGAFVLSGPQGIGKRFLATRIAQQLFQHVAVSTIDLRDLADSTTTRDLLGAMGQQGLLAAPVRTNPYHALILENFERAGTKAAEVLQGILQHGECIDGSTGSRVSFSNCLLFLISHQSVSTTGPTPEQWMETFASQTNCSPTLLNLANECITFSPPDDEAIAQAAICLMMEECRKYQMTLDWVDPEIVVREVKMFSPRFGFEQSRSRIARWISDPIHLAASHGLSRLILTESLLAHRGKSGSPSTTSFANSPFTVQQAN